MMVLLTAVNAAWWRPAGRVVVPLPQAVHAKLVGDTFEGHRGRFDLGSSTKSSSVFGVPTEQTRVCR